VVPDGPHLSEFTVDWMWLRRGDPNLFIGGKAQGRTILPPTGLLWSSGLISRKEKGVVVGSSPRETDAFKAVVRHVGAILGIGKSRDTSSGWAALDVNREDPLYVALDARVQHSAMAHVEGPTSKACVGPWNAFVK
jgi:hypothetical protein